MKPSEGLEATGSSGRESPHVVLPGQTPEGAPILSVLLKRTYDVGSEGVCSRGQTDVKLTSGDVHYDDPMNSSIEVEGDFVPYKIATDVVLNGFVYAPGGRPARSVIASVEVGGVRKDVRVVGDRVARYAGEGMPIFTDPTPFDRMELRYERAYGGVDIYSDPQMPCAYARNPVGCGFAVKNDRRAVDGLSLPNLEDPSDPFTPERLLTGHFMHWERQPLPWSLGSVGKSWHPRAGFAGVMPGDRALEQEIRAAYRQLVPDSQRELYDQTGLPSMDFRFFNGASTGLALPFLKGDEIVKTRCLMPEGEWVIALPGETPGVSLDIGEGPTEGQVVLHTLLVRLEERQIDLVWRAAFPYQGPDWLPEMRRMEVLIE